MFTSCPARIPGTTDLPIMDALASHPDIKYVLGLQESVVMGMADGYAAETSLAEADVDEGKDSAQRFLVGQVMRITGGKANPSVVGELVHRELESRR